MAKKKVKYPFDTCIQDRINDGYSEDSARKICGTIRAKSQKLGKFKKAKSSLTSDQTTELNACIKEKMTADDTLTENEATVKCASELGYVIEAAKSSEGDNVYESESPLEEAKEELTSIVKETYKEQELDNTNASLPVSWEELYN